MAKKKRALKKGKSEEYDDSSDADRSPSPKRKKAKEKEAKCGRKGRKAASMTPAATEPPKPVFNSDFDPTVPYDVPMKTLNPLISCGLCNGYLVDATTVVECLHSFCKSCLMQYFEDEDNCCPTCRTLIHQSHPTHYVAYDRTLQDIVYKLVPGLFDSELERREALVVDEKRQAGEDLEQEAKVKAAKLKELEEDKTNRCFEGKTKNSHHRSDAQMLIEFVRGDDDLPLPNKRFVRTSEMCTITTLKRYLSYAMYGTKARYAEMDLFCNNELMGRDFSMKFILLTRCRKKAKDSPLELVYKHKLEL